MDTLRVSRIRMAVFGAVFLFLWVWAFFGPNEFIEWRWLAIVLGISACTFGIGEWQTGISAFSILTFVLIGTGAFEPVRLTMSVLVGIGFGLALVWPERGKTWSDVYDWQLLKQKDPRGMVILAVLLLSVLFAFQLVGIKEITSQGIFLLSCMLMATVAICIAFRYMRRLPGV